MSTRRAPLLVIGDPGLVSSGLAPDRHSIMQPLWEVAQNVRFYQGKVRRLVPSALVFNFGGASDELRGIHQQQNSDGTRWIFSASVNGTTIQVRRWFGTPSTQVNTWAGMTPNDTVTAKATQVDFQAWGNWTLINLGAGAVYRYMPEGGSGALPNAPTDAVAIFKKQNQLVLIGTANSKRGVAWSDADDITLWTAAADNLAGSLTIEELRTPIRGGARLGQHIAAYSEDQMALVSWIGAPFYYGQRVALDGIGITGKKAVCSDGRLNYGMSRNGAWQTDGNEFRYIDHGVISDYFQANVNWDQGGKILVARNDVTRCIEYHVPTGVNQENSEAWSFDPQSGSWAPVPAFQAMDERVLFDKPLVGANGDIRLLDDDPAAAGALSLITKPFMIDPPEFPGLHIDARIDEIEVAVKVASNVQFRLHNASDIDGPWEMTAQHPLSTDMRTYKMAHLPTGTFHKLEFSSTATNWDMDLQGIALYGAIEGIKRDAT